MQVGRLLERKGNGVVTVSPETPVPEVARLLADRRFGAVPVVDETGALAGILSERDIVTGFAQYGRAFADRTAADLMTPGVVTCSPDNTVADVAAMMDSHGIRHVPVIEHQALAGIVSIRDLVNYRMSQLETDVEVLRSQLLEGVARL